MTIDYNKEKYEKDKIKKFIDKSLKDKFDDKTQDLNLNDKDKIFLYPILSGFTIEIIKKTKGMFNKDKFFFN